MQSNEIKSIFQSTFNDQKNIMTPETVRYGKSGSFLYELSRGLCMNGGELFGVTVLDIRGKHIHALSKSFEDKMEADKYIVGLRSS